jgi:homoserine O-acetyltransferase
VPAQNTWRLSIFASYEGPTGAIGKRFAKFSSLFMSDFMASHKLERWPHQKDHQCVIKPFVFESGETLPELKVAFTTLGQAAQNDSGDIVNAVLLLHSTWGNRGIWLTPSLANELFAKDKPLDASRYFIILPDAIGHGRSSRPSEGLKAAFPRYDQVRAQHILVTQALRISRLRLVLGVSLGGWFTWMWGTMYPEMMDRLVPIGVEPFGLAGRNWIIRRMIIDSIRNDPRWAGGHYEVNPSPHISTIPLLILMAQGVASLQRLVPTRQAADTYYRRLVTEQLGKIDANDLLYALECGLDYDPSADLDRIKARVLAVNFADDELIPVEVNRTSDVVARLPQSRCVMVPESQQSQGHLTYFKGHTWAWALADFLSDKSQ